MTQLKICHWNANGLSQHKFEVEHFLQTKQIDVFLVSETHFTLKNCFRVNGFHTYDTKHPSGKACGGTAILVRRNVNHFVLPEFKENFIQATSINLPNQKITISSVYAPPGHKIEQEQFTKFFSTLGQKFIAAGDYNAKHTFWGSRLATPRGRQLYNTVAANNLDVISDGKPTYWPTDFDKIPDLIDFAVIKGIKREQISVSSSYDLSSDHSPTILTLNNYFPTVDKTPIFYPNINTNWLKYKMYVSSHLSQRIPLRNEADIELAVGHFTEVVDSAAKVATPIKRFIKNKTFRVSPDVQTLVREKRRLRRQWQNSRSPLLKAQLKLCQKMLHNKLKHKREAELAQYLNNLDPNKNTNYSLWKAVRNIKRPVINDPPLRLHNCTWARNSSEKADAFASHLEKVFTPNDTTMRCSTLVTSDNVNNPIKFRFSALKFAINEINLKKSPGPDRITGSMIRHLPTSAVRVILFIFNAMLRIGFFPASWKISEIVMIPKPGKDCTQITSYRPISLLPILSKVFEKMFLRKINPYLNEHHIIPDHQFGFRQEHGTIEQVHRIVTIIRSAFEKKQYCSALFVDISQAFDKVWHDGLLIKISRLLPQNTHKLLKSYLIERKFKVRSKDQFSSVRSASAGVPQGSILGPLLYLIYTADMPTNPKTYTSTFADDTAFISVNSDPKVASEQLQSHILELEDWLKKWKIKVNPQKCAHVTFTLRRENCPAVKIANVAVPVENQVKYLGVHLDRRLTWSRHIEAKITAIKLKTSQLYWIIGPNSTLPLEYKVLLYKSVLRPIWTYAIQLWGTACASNIQKLQRRQSRLLRLIVGAPWYIRNENIHRDLNVSTVQEEIMNYSRKYLNKLQNHPNSYARDLLQFRGHQRLRRIDTLSLAR